MTQKIKYEGHKWKKMLLIKKACIINHSEYEMIYTAFFSDPFHCASIFTLMTETNILKVPDPKYHIYRAVLLYRDLRRHQMNVLLNGFIIATQDADISYEFGHC